MATDGNDEYENILHAYFKGNVNADYIIADGSYSIGSEKLGALSFTDSDGNIFYYGTGTSFSRTQTFILGGSAGTNYFSGSGVLSLAFGINPYYTTPEGSYNTTLNVDCGILFQSAKSNGGYATHDNYLCNSMELRACNISLIGDNTSTKSVISLNCKNIRLTGTTKINGFQVGSGQSPYFESIPVISSAGVMEVGKYIDFHDASTESYDFTARLYCQDTYGMYLAVRTGSSGNFRIPGTFYSNGTAITSDERLKTDISEYGDNWEKAYFEIDPIQFRYKSSTDKLHSGVVAQQVSKVLKDNNLSDSGIVLKALHPTEGLPEQYFVNYNEFIPLNMHMIQKLYKRVEELEAEVKRLGGNI